MSITYHEINNKIGMKTGVIRQSFLTVQNLQNLHTSFFIPKQYFFSTHMGSPLKQVKHFHVILLLFQNYGEIMSKLVAHSYSLRV